MEPDIKRSRFGCVSLIGLAVFGYLSYAALTLFVHMAMGLGLLVMFQFTLGSLLIGLAEGWALTRLLHAERERARKWMIVANYATTAWGVLVAFVLQPEHWFGASTKLYKLPEFLPAMVAILYAAMLVPMCGFCLLVFRGRVLRSFAAAAVLHTAVFAGQWAFYSRSPMLHSVVRVDPSYVAGLAGNATVYFVDNDGHSLNRIELDGTRREKVASLGKIDLEDPDWIFIRPSADGKSLDLWGGGQFGTNEQLILERIAPAGGQTFAERDGEWAEADLRDPQERPWCVLVPPAKFAGAKTWHRTTKEEIYFEIQTPMVAWSCCHPTALPGDRVVFQLDDQIVVWGITEKKLGLLTPGQWPIVVLNLKAP